MTYLFKQSEEQRTSARTYLLALLVDDALQTADKERLIDWLIEAIVDAAVYKTRAMLDDDT